MRQPPRPRRAGSVPRTVPAIPNVNALLRCAVRPDCAERAPPSSTRSLGASRLHRTPLEIAHGTRPQEAPLGPAARYGHRRAGPPHPSRHGGGDRGHPGARPGTGSRRGTRSRRGVSAARARLPADPALGRSLGPGAGGGSGTARREFGGAVALCLAGRAGLALGVHRLFRGGRRHGQRRMGLRRSPFPPRQLGVWVADSSLGSQGGLAGRRHRPPPGSAATANPILRLARTRVARPLPGTGADRAYLRGQPPRGAGPLPGAGPDHTRLREHRPHRAGPLPGAAPDQAFLLEQQPRRAGPLASAVPDQSALRGQTPHQARPLTGAGPDHA